MFEYRREVNNLKLNLIIRLKLEIAFNELQEKEKMEELWFWGKIFGTDADYFIALGINFKDNYEFPQKKLYFTSSTNYTFTPLPETFEYHDKDNFDNYNLPFTGNPALIIKKYVEEVDPNDPANDPNLNNNNNVDPNDPNDPNNVPKINDDESLDNIIVKEEIKENFTEAFKLSYTVRAIDYDTNLIPQGAFRLIPIHELRRNESFRGLAKEDLGDLSKYHHFRPITNCKNKELIETDDAIFRYDFLDNINEDEVKGSWGIQLDSTKTIVKNNHY